MQRRCDFDIRTKLIEMRSVRHESLADQEEALVVSSTSGLFFADESLGARTVWRDWLNSEPG